jgi:ribosomal protein S18 acetylase RimI-like enzyme
VRDLHEARAAFNPLAEHFYLYAPHRPGIAHHFVKRSPRRSELELDYGLHLTEAESDLWRERFAFRDALRANSALALEYEALKLRLAVEKTYPLPLLKPSDRLFVATVGDEIVGFAELELEAWNGRARIEHLYVSPPSRGRGVGRALLDALAERAGREKGFRCLWLETQNVNYPAIQFYRRSGFRLCGLDETLYQPDDTALLPREVALFFARDLSDRI